MSDFANVTGYDVEYGISKDGIVRNSASQEPMKMVQDEDGRNMVSLVKNGKRELVHVDELMNKHWLSQQYKSDNYIIAHINGKMSDDRSSNLVLTVPEGYRQSIKELNTPQTYYIVYNDAINDKNYFYGSGYTGARVYLNRNAVRYNASSGRQLINGPFAGYYIRSANESDFMKPFTYQKEIPFSIPPYIAR